ncbi:carboxylating nicotinate-nucleotide diphosphorylase [Flavobacteriaceae bacterium]|jgi:nicotinate-nucleotide pyrophosphorylase (carboxylating)|nr:carboxylating nicotinate-nucleotide diphosphorylase [Bacteroidota bacterium]MDB2471718.1 carboxylating nicotinate-nucleotide diphosphorylase [Flavobacteriaceae bacterium]MDC0957200.1 carboxylating nicotinate-nucleotide diphosphorylase [Flavobacteriaceae bacterium]MDC3326663.1 carboxylating nicotinate-nucleotide diphosphorylase [Flavobacteriaceae bacterium]|tara:strand:+ start:1220 stop:2077 length:858 start_codon:yes stop_codon:yes gene_type:complete
MISQLEFDKEIDLIIANAIREDIGDGDHTSLACIPKTAHGKAKLMVKEAGIIAGVNFAKHVFNYVDSSLSINIIINEGVFVNEGDIVFYVEGASQSILRAERLVLNGMQRMSAIATKTNVFVNLLHGTKTKILDTRKTTPGIRALEKWAVSIGGGENHRFGLFDMIMLKDNHIDFCGSITKAIINTQQYLKNTNKDLKIIVEARSLGEIEEILRCEGVFRILIDNFSVTDTVKAVKMIGNKCLTESSGNIDETTVRKYAECGVNYISSGALTHSVHNMDLSLKAI